MKSHDPIRSERRLLEALRAAETATLALRGLCATVLPPGPPAAGGPSIGEEAPARVELLEGGWLAVTLEAVLPRRGDSDRSRFLPTPCAQPSAGRSRTGCRPSSTSASWPMNISTARAARFLGPRQPGAEALPGCAGGGVPHQRYLRPLLRLPVQPPGRTERHPHLGPAPPRRSPSGWRAIGSPGRTTGNLKQ